MRPWRAMRREDIDRTISAVLFFSFEEELVRFREMKSRRRFK